MGFISSQLGGDETATPTLAVAQADSTAAERPTPAVDIESPDPVSGPN